MSGELGREWGKRIFVSGVKREIRKILNQLAGDTARRHSDISKLSDELAH
jgi:hypothetical protein